MSLLRIFLILVLAAVLSPADAGNTGKDDILSREQHAAIRRALLHAMPDSDTLVIPPVVPTVARIVVFTDTNCPYCALLHHRHELLSQLGIEIQYIFYPRSGPASESFDQAIAVWCSDDRLAALDRVFDKTTLPVAKCGNPVLQHYNLAREMNLLGTPAIIFADGTVRYGLPSRDDIVGLLGN